MPASTEATGARMSFLVHGVPFEITCEAAVMRDALSRRLRAFAIDGIAGADAVAVTITGPGASPLFAPQLVASGRIVYETTDGEIRYIDAIDHVVSDYAGTVQMNLQAGGDRLDLAVTGAAPADLMVAAYPMFTLALTEILKRRGRYALHAACPASGGRGLLIAGSSGCGKSTLALAFARRGHALLSDDTVFLNDGATTVFGFPDEIDVTDATAEMFAELRHLPSQPKRPGRTKHAVDPTMFGPRPPRRCAPAALVFPRPTATASSHLEPIEPARALQELAANVLLTDQASSQRHLDALGALARRLPAYALATGHDLDAAVDVLAPLFSEDPQTRSISHAAPT